MGLWTRVRFRGSWGIRLGLHPGYRPVIHGRVVDWRPDWLMVLEEGLGTMRPRIIRLARAHLFAADALRREAGGPVHDGVAYEVAPRTLPGHVTGIAPPSWDRVLGGRWRWVGRNTELFTIPTQDLDLRVPRLQSVLHEELAHAWDYRLEEERSPYSSAGARWLAVYIDEATGLPRPFPIPGCNEYDGEEEVWASSVLWYVIRPEEFRRLAPLHEAFVRDLFTRYRIDP